MDSNITPIPGDAEASRPLAEPRHWFLRRLSCPNPFYLLSAACVIHATGVPLNGSGRELAPEWLLAVIAGYAVALALIAFVIVRWWRVWDDARSIFMILLLLFLELALCADGTLASDVSRGTRLLLIGLATAVGVSEFLFRGLRLWMPARFRVPYYVQLSLLFLYPLALVHFVQSGNAAAATWGVFAFGPLCGLAVLTLWPAMRRGPDADDNGTPWQWAWYPWTLFVFLAVCLAFRSYAICVSFDAAGALDPQAAYERMESIFGAYFLVPMLLAAAVLLLEAAITRRRRSVRITSLLMPLVCVGLAFPGEGDNPAAREFIARLLATVGSPSAWILAAVGLMYAVTAWRGLDVAWYGVIAAVAALAVVDPRTTVSAATLVPAQPWWLLAAVALWAWRAWRRGWSGDWLGAAAVLSVALLRFGLFDGWPVPPAIVAAHLTIAAALLIALLRTDLLARWLLAAGPLFLIAGSAAACAWAMTTNPPAWMLFAYLATITFTAAAIGWRPRRLAYLAAAGISIGLCYAALLWQSYIEMRHVLRWNGLASFMLGLLLLHAGIVVSALKGGAHRKLVQTVRDSVR